MMMTLIKKDKNIPVILIAISFIWAGLILGLSFIEAPLKFRAPNITLALGVGIGRLVFKALNKFEIFFCLSLWLVLISAVRNKLLYILVVALTILLTLQSVWLLPELNKRALIVMDGNPPPPNSPHVYYIVMEVIKQALLIVIGIRGIKYLINKHLLHEQ
ncbi:MAG: hypothetical protein K2X86_06155 [Cytophagaceae bacterium]|nr:hypothetical protein [Cytophagaceae bacterium]